MTSDARLGDRALLPRLGDRALFPALEAAIYLNHAAISVPSEPVRTAVVSVIDSYARFGVDAVEQWVENREYLRGRLASMIGAQPQDVALVSNTTHGIVSVAQCLRWQAGDRIITFLGEFPTNVTPWQQAARTFQLDCVQLPLPVDSEGRPSLSGLTAELAKGVRLVAISAVQFQTGWRMPLRAIAEVCHQYGARLLVDGIQAVGVIPLDVVELGVDFLAAGGHKWLMGIEGAGFLYISPDGMRDIEPRTAGWLSHHSALDMLFEGPGHLRYDRPIRNSPDFLESGVTHSAAFAALEASTRQLERLGSRAIWEHVTQWLNALHQGLLDRGIRTCRDGIAASHSGILSIPQSELTARHSEATVATVAKRLGHSSIAVSTPDGYLRFAPHWPNNLSEVDTVLDALDHVLG